MQLEAGQAAQYQRSAQIAVLIGLLDGMAPVPYFLGLDPTVLQIPSIALKLLLVFAFPVQGTASPIRNWFLISVFVLAIVGTLVDTFAATIGWQAVARSWAFWLSTFGTLSLLSERNYGTYLRALFAVPVGAAVVHIVLAQLGLVAMTHGRAFYFNGSHPNLGGEIAAVAAIAAALTLRLRRLMPVALILLYDCLLLQSRAAIVVVAGSLLVRLLWSRTGRQLLAAGVVVVVVLYAAGLVDPLGILRAALQIDDRGRGLDSGFSGRDGHWDVALAIFFKNPLFGAGLSAFVGESLDAHNAFLYGLAMHGVLSVLFWATLGLAFLAVARRSIRDFLILASGWTLLLFNDRFLNLNIYPMAYYVVVVCYPLVQMAQPAPAKPLPRLWQLTGRGISAIRPAE